MKWYDSVNVSRYADVALNKLKELRAQRSSKKR